MTTEKFAGITFRGRKKSLVFLGPSLHQLDRQPHAPAAFTLGIYSHVLPHMQEQAALKVEEVLLGRALPGNQIEAGTSRIRVLGCSRKFELHPSSTVDPALHRGCESFQNGPYSR
jgi:hypothetical protein